MAPRRKNRDFISDMLDQILDRAYQYLAYGVQEQQQRGGTDGYTGYASPYYDSARTGMDGIEYPWMSKRERAYRQAQEDWQDRQRSSKPNHPWARPKPKKKKPTSASPRFEAAGTSKRRSRASKQEEQTRSRTAPSTPDVSDRVTKAYAFLGVKKGDVKIEDIKELRRKLAFRYHGDKGGDERIMKEVNAAVDCVLADLRKKI